MMDVPVAAGAAATGLFAIGTLPILVKAGRTRDVRFFSPFSDTIQLPASRRRPTSATT